VTRKNLNRRHFLAGITGGIAGFAGCLGVPQSDTDETTTEEDPSETVRVEKAEDGRYEQVYASVVDGVVSVEPYESSGSGSGFIYDNYIVTNEHVIGSADEADIRFSDGSWTTATVVGSDSGSDIAVLEAAELSDTAVPLELYDDIPVVGEEIAAIGNPYGLDETLSTGVVSGVERSMPAPNGFTIPDSIQIDASVNPGNSGGPLVTLDGQVVGVITAATGDGIGFAISSRLADRVVPNLLTEGEYDHPFLGVQTVTVTPRIAEKNDLGDVEGVCVVEVMDDTPAEGRLEAAEDTEWDSGEQIPLDGDIIQKVNGDSIETNEDLTRYLSLNSRPGDDVDFEVIRNGQRESVTIEIGIQPTDV